MFRCRLQIVAVVRFRNMCLRHHTHPPQLQAQASYAYLVCEPTLASAHDVEVQKSKSGSGVGRSPGTSP